MNRKQKVIISFVFLFFLMYTMYMYWSGEEEPVLAQSIEVEEVEVVETSYKVDIKGAVASPGVYEVSSSARIIDVIELAGGLKEKANTDYLNLSKKVEDGSVIWIYTDEEIQKLTETKTVVEYIEKECNCPDVSNSACISKETVSDGKININTATKEELLTLTGVGESKAEAIIEYRSKTPFTTIEDIKNVSGIGDSAYEKIKDNITV